MLIALRSSGVHILLGIWFDSHSLSSSSIHTSSHHPAAEVIVTFPLFADVFRGGHVQHMDVSTKEQAEINATFYLDGFTAMKVM